MSGFDISYALLAMQSALLGMVTPTLRAVVVSLNPTKKELGFFFFYDGELSEELKEIASCVATEASAAFPIDFEVEEHILQLDYLEKIVVEGKYAFLRKEP